MPTPHPALREIPTAGRCPAVWSAMRGDDRVRVCDRCSLHVYDISAMTADEAQALIEAHAGRRLCVRLRLRPDGTVLTQPCPVAQRSFRRRLRNAIAFLTGFCAVFAAYFSARVARYLGIPTYVEAEQLGQY